MQETRQMAVAVSAHQIDGDEMTDKDRIDGSDHVQTVTDKTVSTHQRIVTKR
jgi:hypothetical protein